MRQTTRTSKKSRRTTKTDKSGKLMLINHVKGEECRIAIIDEEGKLEEFFMERASSESYVGNIYKGIVTNIEPGIQAAFVDFGVGKNGFLHISDLHPQYFQAEGYETENVGRKISKRDRPPIQHCLRRGQEIICQVIRDGIGTKGPTLTTYLSIPGRYLVMMPGMNKVGISRKIEDEKLRRQLKEVVRELDLPKGMGFIIRTAGADRTKREIRQDLNYLKRLWKTIQHRIHTTKAPGEIYQESDFVTRTIREVYTSSIKRIIVDDPTIAQKIRDFLRIVVSRHQHKVEYYNGEIPIFYKYGIENKIAKASSKRVELGEGAFIIIDQIEGGVYIDVNSGSFRQHEEFEQTAFEVNLRAASEIAQQLKLRDLGGIIIIDFIDMREEKHKRAVERRLREALKNDRAKTRMLKISSFGILELTRQKVGPSLEHSVHTVCPCCGGMGRVKIPQTLSLDIIRLIQLIVHQANVKKVEVKVGAEIFEYMQNKRRGVLAQLEAKTGKEINIRMFNDTFAFDKYEVKCFDNRGREIPLSAVIGENGEDIVRKESIETSRQIAYKVKPSKTVFEEIEEV